MAITYSISGGADAAKFNIDASTGALSFKAAPDFEKPGDANQDNVYEVQVKATDAGGASTTQDMRVTVKDVSENLPPQITSAAAVSVNENQTTVTTVTATDPDEGGSTPPPDTGAFWTAFAETTPTGEGSTFTGAGTRKIYVSASGNDSNPGTQASPKKTISSAKALLRNGKPDWILFKKGDTWTDQDFGNLSGREGLSPTAPMLFGAYGTGKRPLFKTSLYSGSQAIGWYSGSANNIAIVGLDFYAHKRDPDSATYDAASTTLDCFGLICNASTSYLLVEDCKFSFYGDNIVVQGSSEVVKFRRCVIVGAYRNSTAHSQGAYLAGTKNLTIEDCVWDHNGWNEKVGGNAGATMFNRNLYISEKGTGPATVTGNFFSRSSSEGMQLRTGGSMKNNFCYQNCTGFDVGHQKGEPAPTITTATVTDNVVMHSQAGRPGRNGYGICVINASGSGIQLHDNIISHDEDTNQPPDGRAVYVDESNGVVVTTNIIFKWKNGILNTGGSSTLSPNAIDLPGANTAGYPAPNRDLSDYYASVGGTNSVAEFYIAICNQSRDNWDDKLTAKAVVNYIRGGFGLGAV